MSRALSARVARHFPHRRGSKNGVMGVSREASAAEKEANMARSQSLPVRHGGGGAIGVTEEAPWSICGFLAWGESNELEAPLSARVARPLPRIGGEAKWRDGRMLKASALRRRLQLWRDGRMLKASAHRRGKLIWRDGRM